MERVAPTGRSGRPFGQSISQQYQDLRTNPMGNGAHGSHSARNTGDNGQENSNGSSRKRIALAVSLRPSLVLRFLTRDGSAHVAVRGR